MTAMSSSTQQENYSYTHDIVCDAQPYSTFKGVIVEHTK